MMFYFGSILQVWIILTGFRDTNDFVNLGICKHEFKFTCRGYCRFTLIIALTPYGELSDGEFSFVDKMSFQTISKLRVILSKYREIILVNIKVIY